MCRGSRNPPCRAVPLRAPCGCPPRLGACPYTTARFVAVFSPIQKPSWLKIRLWGLALAPVPGLARPTARSSAAQSRAPWQREEGAAAAPKPLHTTPLLTLHFYAACLSPGPEPQTGHRARGEIRLFSRYPKLPVRHLIALIMTYSNIKETSESFPLLSPSPHVHYGDPPPLPAPLS